MPAVVTKKVAKLRRTRAGEDLGPSDLSDFIAKIRDEIENRA